MINIQEFFDAPIKSVSTMGKKFVQERTPYSFDKDGTCVYRRDKYQLKVSRITDEAGLPIPMTMCNIKKNIHINQIRTDKELTHIMLLLVFLDGAVLHRIPMKTVERYALTKQNNDSSLQWDVDIHSVTRFAHFKW